jgi:riboflavin synthase
VFTGLIQTLGNIKPLDGDSWQITCIQKSADVILQDIAYGDSIAVDGICLTVDRVLDDGFIATASPETVRRTILGMESSHQRIVNLEASLRVGSKVGGHFVMGHVDGIGQLLTSTKTATSWEMTFTAPDAIARYIVPKGSIAINGISLTVAEYYPETRQFKTAVIPITYADTNLQYLSSGSWVNLEGDILGKYVEKFITGDGLNQTAGNGDSMGINPAFLAENGYL